MAKHKVGGVKAAGDHRKQTRMSCLNNRTPIHEHLPEIMSLDESETLLGSHYSGTDKFVSPSVTIVELGVNCAASDTGTIDGIGTIATSSPRTVALNAPTSFGVKKRLPSISSVAIPSPYTEQTTITSTGKLLSSLCIMIQSPTYPWIGCKVHVHVVE